MLQKQKKEKKKFFDFSKPFPKNEKIALWIALIAGLLAIGISTVEVLFPNNGFTTIEGVSVFMGFAAICALVLLPIQLVKFIIWKIGHKIHKADEARRQEQATAAEKQRQLEKEAEQKRMDLYASGRWPFPNASLYDRCKITGVTDLNSEFARQKAYTVAKQILKEEGVPYSYYPIYIGEAVDFGGEKLANRFKSGRQHSDQVAAEREADRRKPKNGGLKPEHADLQKMAKGVRTTYGIKKRQIMLDDSIRKLNKKIEQYIEGQKAMRELGVILGSSVSQESKKDWAFLGGIADGIAGPGAGIAVAANAMAENAAIEERNRQAREAATQTMYNMYRSADSLSGEISTFEKARDLMQRHRNDSEGKVVMSNYRTEEIWKKIQVRSNVCKPSSAKYLEVNLTVKNKFAADVPENVRVAVDGTLEAKIYYEGTFVDQVTIALPLFGVEQNISETVTGYSPRYVEAEGNYTVEVQPNQLWIVEV